MKRFILTNDAEELEAFLKGFKHFYGDRDLSPAENLAFANGWHCALAWVTAEAMKAEAEGAALVLEPRVSS